MIGAYKMSLLESDSGEIIGSHCIANKKKKGGEALAVFHAKPGAGRAGWPYSHSLHGDTAGERTSPLRCRSAANIDRKTLGAGLQSGRGRAPPLQPCLEVNWVIILGIVRLLVAPSRG